jgi:hypothetical protein
MVDLQSKTLNVTNIYRLWGNSKVSPAQLNGITVQFQYQDTCQAGGQGYVDQVLMTITFDDLSIDTVPPPSSSSTTPTGPPPSGTSSVTAGPSTVATDTVSGTDPASATTTGDSKSQTAAPAPAAMNPAIFGAIGGAVLLGVIGVVVGVFVYKRRKLRNNHTQLRSTESATSLSLSVTPIKEDIYHGMGARSSASSSKPNSRIAVPVAFEIKQSDIVFDQEVGAGNYGVVYKGLWGKREVAIKQLKNLSEEEQIKFEEEVNVMK